MKRKINQISKMQIITIGLILGGIGFFSLAKAQDTPVIMDKPPANLPIPDGVKMPDKLQKPPTASPQNISADLQKPVAFKQVVLMLTDFNLDKTEYSSGDTVKGSFKLKNDSNMYSSGFYYKVTLLRTESPKEGVISFSRSNNIDYTQSEIFNVNPQEEKNIPFSIKIPKFSPTGSDYAIRISVFNSRGSELTSNFQKIAVNNAGGNLGAVFMTEENSQIFGTDRDYKVQEGPVFEYGQEYNPMIGENEPNKDVTLKNEIQAKIAYSIQKNTEGKVTAKVSFYKHGNYLKAVDSKTYPVSNDFSKDKSGFLNLTLPLFQDPGTYEAVVQLFDGNEKVSNFLGVRYTTKGDSGLVYDFLVEKNGGNNFTLNLLFAGPGDSMFSRRNGENPFEAQIVFEAREEKTQKVCFEKTIDIKPGAEVVTQLPFVLGDCVAPYQFDARIQKDGKILDQQKILEPEKTGGENKKSIRSIIFVGFGVLTIVLLAIIVFFYKKRPNKFVPIVILTLAITLGLFAGSAKETKAADFHSSAGGYWNYIKTVPALWGYSCSYTPISCPAGYGPAYGCYDWMYPTDNYCCPNYAPCWVDVWNSCSDGWGGSYPWVMGTGGTTCVSYPTAYFSPFNYLLQNYKTVFNPGETMSILETVVPFVDNCYNDVNFGSGYTNYYVYNAAGTLVWSSGYSFGEYYSTTAFGMGVPMVFGPGNYVLYISAWKAFYAGQDDPMYSGSDWISLPFTIVDPNPTLTVSKSGYGTVSGTGINCGTTCSASYALNTPVSLTALASDSNSTFTGWTGNCSGTGACNLVMDSAKSVSASFSCNCSATENTSHCQGTTYINSCGNTCSGTQIESDGVCGSATTQSWSNEPTTNLCSYGTDSGMTKVGNNWKWTCSGTCGGKNVSCTARRDNNWKEVSP